MKVGIEDEKELEVHVGEGGMEQDYVGSEVVQEEEMDEELEKEEGMDEEGEDVGPVMGLDKMG